MSASHPAVFIEHISIDQAPKFVSYCSVFGKKKGWSKGWRRWHLWHCENCRRGMAAAAFFLCPKFRNPPSSRVDNFQPHLPLVSSLSRRSEESAIWKSGLLVFPNWGKRRLLVLEIGGGGGDRKGKEKDDTATTYGTRDERRWETRGVAAHTEKLICRVLALCACAVLEGSSAIHVSDEIYISLIDLFLPSLFPTHAHPVETFQF